MKFVLSLVNESKEALAKLEMTSLPTADPKSLLLEYDCVLDDDVENKITLKGIPRRADPLKLAVDALSNFGCNATLKKASKKKKPQKAEPQDVR